MNLLRAISTTMNIHRVRTGCALLAVLLPASVFAATHIVEITWSIDGRFSHRAQVAPGKFVEACGKFAVGDSVGWSFEAAAPVDFNIHYHLGKDVVYPARQAQVSTGRSTLKVELPQDYCWMWTNKGTAPVGLTLELRR